MNNDNKLTIPMEKKNHVPLKNFYYRIRLA